MVCYSRVRGLIARTKFPGRSQADLSSSGAEKAETMRRKSETEREKSLSPRVIRVL